MRLTRPWAQTLAAFSFYLLASVLLFARPVLGHLGSECLCIPTTTDEGIVAWGFAWFPHALLHGLNPFYPRLIYAPQGINLAHGTLMPLLALVIWPLTALSSPLAAFNVAATLAPALAATTAFHLCRTLSGRATAALVGGWLFGFSTYMLGQETSHLNLSLVFLVPVIVEVCVTAAPLGRRSARRSTVYLAILLAAQLLLSLEIFASVIVFGAVALACGYGFAAASLRAQLRGLIGAVAAAIIAACVICSPYLYYALKPGGAPVSTAKSTKFSADLLSFVIPNQLTRAGGVHFLGTTEHFSAGYVEGAVYLGVPLLALLVLALWRFRGLWWARALALTVARGVHLRARRAPADRWPQDDPAAVGPARPPAAARRGAAGPLRDVPGADLRDLSSLALASFATRGAASPLARVRAGRTRGRVTVAGHELHVLELQPAGPAAVHDCGLQAGAERRRRQRAGAAGRDLRREHAVAGPDATGLLDGLRIRRARPGHPTPTAPRRSTRRCSMTRFPPPASRPTPGRSSPPMTSSAP